MDTVLLVNASTKSESHRQKIAGVCRYARMRKWNVQLVEPGPDAASHIAHYRRVFRPLGAVVETRGYDFVSGRALRGLPTVYLDSDRQECGDDRLYVHCDQAAVARLAFKEFKATRFPNVAYAGWFEAKFWSKARAEAFSSVAAAEGVRCFVFTPKPGQSSAVEYDEALCRWLGGLPSATGVFAANDEVASHVLACCRRLGLDVPREIAVLGVDNDSMRCEMESPTLSSIQLDFESAGYKACDMLGRRLSGAALPSRHVEFGPLGILRRESTQAFQRVGRQIAAAMDLIRAKACEGLRAHEVAAVIGGSRRLAEMRFREAFGKSILEEIQDIRFERIRFLLANTTKPVGAIANFCGYKSPETLRRLFARREEMSMSEYRARNAAEALRSRR